MTRWIVRGVVTAFSGPRAEFIDFSLQLEIFLNFWGSFGVGIEVFTRHQFCQHPGTRALGVFDRSVVLFEVDEALDDVHIDIDGIGEDFLAAIVGSRPTAAAFHCENCLLVGSGGGLPVALLEVEVA